MPLARTLLFIVAACRCQAAAEIVAETESTPFPGIRILERQSADPPLSIVAAFISLTEPSLLVNATKPTRQLRSVEEWARETGALVAVNGDFHRIHDGTPHLYGAAVGDGEPWTMPQTGNDPRFQNEWFYQRYGWIAFTGDANSPVFSNTGQVKQHPERFKTSHGWKPGEATHEIPPHTRALVSGFSQLVVEGNPIVCDDPSGASCFPDRGDMRARHPRTAMGLNAEMDTFILVVVDGRSANSVGVNGVELAALMHQLGSWVAINLDGGASSQLYVQGRGIINSPSATPHRRTQKHRGVLSISR